MKFYHFLISDAENANRRVCCEERAPDWNRNHDSRCNRVECLPSGPLLGMGAAGNGMREGRSDLLPVLNILHVAARRRAAYRVGHGRKN